MLTDPYQYIIALYDLYNIFLIDFDKKVFIIKVILEKLFLLETFKEGDCNFPETLENFYFKS